MKLNLQKSFAFFDFCFFGFVLFFFQKPHANMIIATERFIFKISGVYPENVFNSFSLILLFVTLFFSLNLLFALFARLVKTNDANEIITILFYLPQQMSYVLKLINIIVNGEKLLRIEEILNENLFNLHKDSQNCYLNDAINRSNLIANIYKIIVYIVLTTFALQPFFADEFTLTLPTSYPIDDEKYIIEIYTLQTVSLLVSCTINTNIDITDFRLISMGSAQIDVLMDNLENVITDDDLRNFNEKQLDDVVEERLKISVRHHQIILDYLRYVEELFTYGNFSQFILCMMVICMTCFNMLMVIFFII